MEKLYTVSKNKTWSRSLVVCPERSTTTFRESQTMPVLWCDRSTQKAWAPSGIFVPSEANFPSRK